MISSDGLRHGRNPDDPEMTFDNDTQSMRKFDTGATRDTEEGKYDYEGFLSPLVIQRFGEYMHKHRKQSDGNLRASDNWQSGMPLSVYIKSAWRHFMDWWLHHRGLHEFAKESLQDALCAILFNVQGYLHEILRKKRGPEQRIRDILAE